MRMAVTRTQFVPGKRQNQDSRDFMIFRIENQPSPNDYNPGNPQILRILILTIVVC